MRKTDKLRIRRSELREELTRAETDEQRNNITGELRTLEQQYRQAIQDEAEEDERAAAEVAADRNAGLDSEGREREELRSRSLLSRYAQAAADGRDVDGREREYRQSILGDFDRAGLVPLDMLDVRDEEERADAVTSTANITPAVTTGTRAPMLHRIFERTIARRFGITMSAVAIGTASYPYMTAGTDAEQKSPSTAVDAGAATFAMETLSPRRLTARYLFQVEDTVRLPMLEETLRRDLRLAMSDKMDDQVVNGNGTAPNVAGLLHELTDPVAATAVVTFESAIQVFTALVDAKHSYSMMDQVAMIGVDTYKKLANEFLASTDTSTSLDYLSNHLGDLFTSARLAAQDAGTKIQQGLVALNGVPGRNAVCPVWRAFELIRDPYSDAASGQIALTAYLLWNFKVVREEAYKQINFKLAT